MIKLIKEFLKTGIEANKTSITANESSLLANKLHLEVGFLHKELINTNIKIANNHWKHIIAEENKQKENSENI